MCKIASRAAGATVILILSIGVATAAAAAPNYHQIRTLEHAVMVYVDRHYHGTPFAGTECGYSKIGSDRRGTYYCYSQVWTTDRYGAALDVRVSSKVRVARNGRSWQFV